MRALQAGSIIRSIKGRRKRRQRNAQSAQIASSYYIPRSVKIANHNCKTRYKRPKRTKRGDKAAVKRDYIFERNGFCARNKDIFMALRMCSLSLSRARCRLIAQRTIVEPYLRRDTERATRIASGTAMKFRLYVFAVAGEEFLERARAPQVVSETRKNLREKFLRDYSTSS